MVTGTRRVDSFSFVLKVYTKSFSTESGIYVCSLIAPNRPCIKLEICDLETVYADFAYHLLVLCPQPCEVL